MRPDLLSRRHRISELSARTVNSYSLPIDDISKKMEYDTHIAVKIQIRSDALDRMFFDLYSTIREPIMEKLHEEGRASYTRQVHARQP